MRILKRLVRNILPARVHGALRRVVHTRRLDRAPVRAVDVAPLPRAAEISFPDTLRGDGMADGWKRRKARSMKSSKTCRGSHAIDSNSRRAIYHLIRRLRPRSVLEIGTNRGASTLYAAMAMREYRNAGRPPRLVTVDLFDVNNPATAEAKRYRISTPPRRCWPGWIVLTWSSSPSPDPRTI